MQRRRLLALGTGALVAPQPARAQRLEAFLAPRARLWERWTAHDPASTQRVDHAAWDGFLARHRRVGANGIARLAYGAVTPADRQALEGYVSMLIGVAPDRLSRPEQYAFWVNLYNALTVRTVLFYYPVASIRDINLSGGLLVRGPWDAKLATVSDEAISLSDVEHRILRPIWRDPRTHYVLNCASLGCPDLPAQALTARNAETLLDQAARGYVNHPRGVARRTDGSLTVSSIYNWFAEDFAANGGVLPHLTRHASPALAEVLRRGPAIAGYGYDWSLNDLR
jgi:hypothetical protein